MEVLSSRSKEEECCMTISFNIVIARTAQQDDVVLFSSDCKHAKAAPASKLLMLQAYNVIIKLCRQVSRDSLWRLVSCCMLVGIESILKLTAIHNSRFFLEWSKELDSAHPLHFCIRTLCGAFVTLKGGNELHGGTLVLFLFWCSSEIQACMVIC